MLSLLRKNLLYTDISRDIVEHDEDIDADLFTIDGREVYRGSIDPRYTHADLDVHWLYDDALKRVGLIEYDMNDRTISETLWIYENPYSTYFQEPGWTTKNQTVWSKLSNEAYQDCLEHDFERLVDMSLSGDTRIILPSMLSNPPKEMFECQSCQKRTLSLPNGCLTVKKLSFSGIFSLFLDDSFIIYYPPPTSAVWTTLGLRRDDDQTLPEQQLGEQQESPPSDSPLKSNSPEQEEPQAQSHPELPQAPHPPHP